ncbi:FAD-dependent oxidoreductase [Roseovarius sp. SYSU LYC5161]|uniref:FAD-dependent oxidoreductase n=1 Tax=Roseovarius halophilus (ex Wu et al. 2025) TaxID=3376060 RepID=UPI003999EEC4
MYPDFIDGNGILMLPKNRDNPLVAGRATGSDRIAHTATRNMACCAVSGQGAGVAAALSLRHACPLDMVNITDSQTTLARQGVRPHEPGCGQH